MITQFRVHNYKGLRDVALDLTPVHVLIGPNNSGKTSILEAIQALCRSVDFPLEQAFVGSWKGRELVWGGQTDGIVSVAASVREGKLEFDYELKCLFANPQDGRTVYGAGETYRDSASIDLTRQDAVSFVCGNNRHRVAANPEQSSAASRVHDALSGVQIYRWDARLLALPAAPDSTRQFRMEPSGFGLALCLDDILGYSRELFGDMETRFRRIFPEIKSIKLIPQSAFRASPDHTKSTPLLQVSDGKGIYFQLENNSALVPASQASDGVLLVLAYLTILSLPQPPKVILLEEPENGIHPKRLREVLSILRDLVKERPNTQILLTTHSPYVLDMFEPEEVTVCQQRDGETRIARLSTSKSVSEQLDIFSLGEIWTAEGDDKIAIPLAPAGVRSS